MTTHELSDRREQISLALLTITNKTQNMRSDLLQIAESRPSALCDGIDHAKAETDLFARLELNHFDLFKKEALESALARISQGTYGLCQYCEEVIDQRRLVAHPTARFCLKCQSKTEKFKIRKQS